MFMLHSRLAAQPGQRDALLAILQESESAEPMPGCRMYLIAVDDADADGVWVTELWESQQAHADSLGLERVGAQMARAAPLLDRAGFRQQRMDARAGVPSR